MDSKQLFLRELHSIIKEYAEVGDQLKQPDKQLSWEEFDLTEDEISALNSQNFTDESIIAIEKIVRDNIMGAFHSAFCLLDGVSDPVLENEEDIWVGLKLEEKQDEDEEFLHDELYSSYWDWHDLNNKDK
ncbi:MULTISPECIES: hypothetical protein [Priestia]|uniref:hypothetical protein n=1 Tax=Priestia TaxID=2800373 RepID=UPI0003FB186A|nr:MULTISPECIES: hypothetical protein [Priestia]ANF45705.1 hypothetical protein AZK53_08415 [Priestia megaterium]AQU73369.1 hypothetical protein BUW91_08645 [Priestia megaterium]MCU7764698.1 hypothetical protein [Priestia megaterium]